MKFAVIEPCVPIAQNNSNDNDNNNDYLWNDDKMMDENIIFLQASGDILCKKLGNNEKFYINAHCLIAYTVTVKTSVVYSSIFTYHSNSLRPGKTIKIPHIHTHPHIHTQKKNKFTQMRTTKIYTFFKNDTLPFLFVFIFYFYFFSFFFLSHKMRKEMNS